MNANDVYEKIQQIAATRVGGTPVFIDELASALGKDRVEIVSYLVDLKIAGHIDFDKRTVSLTVTILTDGTNAL